MTGKDTARGGGCHDKMKLFIFQNYIYNSKYFLSWFKKKLIHKQLLVVF